MFEFTDLVFANFRLSVLPMADAGLQLRLVSASDFDAAHCARMTASIGAALRELPAVSAVVPSFDCVTLWLTPHTQVNALVQQIEQTLQQLKLEQTSLAASRQHRIRLSRDLEPEFQDDLAFCAANSGISPEAWLARFCQSEFTVGCLGFRPGFGYLLGLPAELACPRRANPRLRVPAGAIAVGGPYAGIYPGSGPGGWHVLGLCLESLFDPLQTPPCRFAVGDAVQFFV